MLDAAGRLWYLDLRLIRKFEGGPDMSKYRTKQRTILLDYLEAHADESLSAKQIAEALNDQGVSVSAVYRNLAALEAENRVRRISQGSGREGLYQYTDTSACKDCLHLLCSRCGRTYHMDHQGANLLERHLAAKEGFRIDRASTVLYGVCEECQDEPSKPLTQLLKDRRRL